jgi:mRNA interferase HigB
MRIIALKMLKAFWTEHPRAEVSIRAWYTIVKKADWATPADVRAQFASADFVADNRVIFNVGGNVFRIVVRISYPYRLVLIKFVGTHREYDDIDPETV